MTISNRFKSVAGLCVLAGAGLMSGCTDAQTAKFGGLGEQAKVDVYSGGKLIYTGISTGKVSSEANSDGYYFRDKATGKLMEVSGQVVITYDYKGPTPTPVAFPNPEAVKVVPTVPALKN